MRLLPARTSRPAALLAAATALLLLTNCTSQTPSTAPSASPSSAPRADDAPTYRFDIFQMEAALPATYRRQSMDVDSYFINLDGGPRDDPLEGLEVEPEACRAMIRSSGFTTGSLRSFRSDTPAAGGGVDLGDTRGDQFVSAVLYELTGAEAERYQNLRFHPAPECRQIRIEPGSARASIVQRPLVEFGAGSRYIVKVYPKAGKPRTERTLFFRTPAYAGEVRASGPVGSEADFLAFARIVRNRAAQKLR